MEVKPGYKQTEVGVIPEEWGVRRLGSIATLERGKFTARPRNQPRFFGGDIPFIQTGDITNSNGSITSYTQTLNNEGLRVSKLFPRETLFFTIAANIGDVGIAAFETAATDSVIAISPHRGIEKRWLYHSLRWQKATFEGLATQNAQANINLEKLRPYSLAVPPQPEQRAIAGALGDVDALLGALEKLIAKKRDLKQAVMQQLLTGQTRLPGFSGEWEVKRLGNVGSFSKGRDLSKGELADSGNVPAIPYTAIYTDFAEVIGYSKIENFIDSTSNAAIITGPHLLIAGSSNVLENIGKATAYVDNAEVAVGGDIIIYRTTADVRFLSYLLSTQPHRNRVVSLSQGSTIRHVYRSTFEGYELALPSNPEQTAITELLSDMDAEIGALEKRLAKTQAFKQGMMQELLTGRVRLI